VFRDLAARNHLADAADKEEFARGAAWFLSEINAVHPFREGNGRIQLVFLTMLARNAGYELHEHKLRAKPFLAAMIRSFSGDVASLTAEIHRLLWSQL
jgi:cell filamentation protein